MPRNVLLYKLPEYSYSFFMFLFLIKCDEIVGLINKVSSQCMYIDNSIHIKFVIEFYNF